jgi:hypothetical protein
MPESVSALQEGVCAKEPSLFEMASLNLSSVFLILFAASKVETSGA